jgi:hypothetical protein
MDTQNKESWCVEFDKKLDEWLDTEQHEYSCTSHSEGQYCCLDNTDHEIENYSKRYGREFVKSFISNLLATQKKKAYKAGLEKGRNDMFLELDNLWVDNHAEVCDFESAYTRWSELEMERSIKESKEINK